MFHKVAKKYTKINFKTEKSPKSHIVVELSDKHNTEGYTIFTHQMKCRHSRQKKNFKKELKKRKNGVVISLNKQTVGFQNRVINCW